MKLFSILTSLYRRESGRLALLERLRGNDKRLSGGVEKDRKYFSVVEISGDSILYVCATFTHLSMCYDYITFGEYNRLDINRTFGIVYHNGNERLSNKRLVSCKLVCIYGFISVETLRAISEKKDKFY